MTRYEFLKASTFMCLSASFSSIAFSNISIGKYIAATISALLGIFFLLMWVNHIPEDKGGF